jgi:hypothetical protein
MYENISLDSSNFIAGRKTGGQVFAVWRVSIFGGDNFACHPQQTRESRKFVPKFASFATAHILNRAKRRLESWLGNCELQSMST